MSEHSLSVICKDVNCLREMGYFVPYALKCHRSGYLLQFCGKIDLFKYAYSQFIKLYLTQDSLRDILEGVLTQFRPHNFLNWLCFHLRKTGTDTHYKYSHTLFLATCRFTCLVIIEIHQETASFRDASNLL